MAYEFIYKRRVQFAETDMAGIMHFSYFFHFMEEAEHAFLRSLNLSVHMHDKGDDNVVTFPRVSAACDFKHPLRFEDEVDVCLRVVNRSKKTITYQFEFCKAEYDEPAATGSITVVCATKNKADGSLQAIVIPANIAANIEVAPK